jgi:hypothetical protein
MQTDKKSTPGEFKITRNWETSAKELRKDHSNLTAEDVKFETGKENDLLGRIERRLVKKREEVISIINNIQAKK